MVDFAGWLMPVQYASIVEEHQATRQAIGLFDVSHMGRINFSGPGAADFLDRLVTRDVKSLARGQVRYALVTNEAGGILDDVLVYHLAAGTLGVAYGESYYQLVVNASNRAQILDWIESQKPDRNSVKIQDRTLETAMIAVQGPKAIEAVKPLSSVDPASLKYYTATEAKLAGVPGIIGRTGYTGEDGWELIVPANVAVDIWKSLVERGAQPAGLGCRDTLRLEAGMPLYGHELNEGINPYQAGLGFAVNLEGRQFPGRDSLARFATDANQPKRIGLELIGKRVPREHFGVFAGDTQIGEVTSGTFSPTLQRPIAMAYVAPKFAEPGAELTIDIRGKREPARVVKLPFYKRNKGN